MFCCLDIYSMTPQSADNIFCRCHVTYTKKILEIENVQLVQQLLEEQRKRRVILRPRKYPYGGVAAFITTPLDVAKTRIMLAKAGTSTASGNIPLVLYEVWKCRGVFGLFAGSIPRITLISVGGFIFLGAYEKVRHILL
ncbi:S-adenosylmethionine mitochondrial carrier protein [Bagarius yarrelli]|uniref:Mitochondrial S-adenosylmethionine carrier protein n=1 Tax=Bagarius yarrelli TaxID=175774 RepID=A0A556V9B3_BAGYA|nr:S-adenosylmethionine mitochondrial carrier protein [Bagarius yarrelli]